MKRSFSGGESGSWEIMREDQREKLIPAREILHFVFAIVVG
jgi:hypothetical protein